MNTTHLTDELLQAFLLGETQDESIAQHLEACSECQAKQEAYQQVLTGLKQIEPETFAFDVTSVVMVNIQAYEQRKSSRQTLYFWGMVTGFVLILLGSCLPFLPSIRTIFTQLSFFTTLLVVGTGAGVLVLLLVDLFKQHKQKERLLFDRKVQPIQS